MDKYNINIVSRYEAILIDTRDLENECIFISINSGSENHHKFRNPNIKDVLYLDFDDIQPHNLKKNSQSKTMTLEQAYMIKKFIEEHKNTTTIYVHCTAGVSRSAAIGFILTKYLNKHDDLHLFQSGKYEPNKWVYKLMSEAFNMPFSKSEFRRKSNISSKKCLSDLKGYGAMGISLAELMGEKK